MSLALHDQTLQKVARAVAGAFGDKPWTAIRYVSRWNPTGDAGTDRFWRKISSGDWVKDQPASARAIVEISDAALAHRNAGSAGSQQGWFALVLNLKNDGTFKAEYEFRDSYEAGDILADLPGPSKSE